MLAKHTGFARMWDDDGGVGDDEEHDEDDEPRGRR